MKSRFAGWVAGVVLLLACVSARGQSAVLSGVVRDGMGAVAGGATVFVEHWSVDQNGKAFCVTDGVAVADQNGAYKLSLRPGIYSVLISFPAMQPRAAEVEIEAGKSKTLDVELKVSSLWKRVE